MPWAVSCSSSTERISEPSCSSCERRWACSLVSSSDLDAVDLAMEDVGERPQQVLDIVFEPGVRQHGGEVIDDGGESATDRFGFGQRARIGFVPARPVTIEGQFVEQMRGR